MKSTASSLLAFLTLVLTLFIGDAHAERVLFIGNSYTGVNNLPKIYQQIVASTGAPAPDVGAATPGGKTLEQHLSEAKTLKLIDSGNWDFVVLQGQSQEAAMAQGSKEIRASFRKGAKGLFDLIKAKSPKARIVFYQTWARHADYWNNPKTDLALARPRKRCSDAITNPINRQQARASVLALRPWETRGN